MMPISLLASFETSAEVVNDFSRLNPIEVDRVISVESIDDILEVLEFARKNSSKVSIAGKRNSQGGHTARKDAIVLNMENYNKVLAFSLKAKTIIVESGATWAEIQKFINKKNLAVKVAQSSNIFSVGGSLSVNAHGRDPRHGAIVETVSYFKIVLSDGRHLKASRSENPEIFYAAIGGYGLLGVITEVELFLTENYWLEKKVLKIPYSNYVQHLDKSLNHKLALHYGRCSIVKDENFFKDCIAVDYIQIGNVESNVNLEAEKNVFRDKLFFSISRQYDWGKSLRWWLQGIFIDSPSDEYRKITRNNAMRPPISFTEYYSENDTDILQEYFVPKDNFNEYLSKLGDILLKYDVNILSMTMRYVPKGEGIYLDYAESDSISVVLYMNIELDKVGLEKARRWTTKIVDLTEQYDGKYYLTYQRFPTKEQFRKSYPRWRDFKMIKNKHDPHEIFVSEFYKQYF